VADSRREGGGGRASINQMHLKTSENIARKCIIFASNFHNFSGEGASSSDPTLYPSASPLFQFSASADELTCFSER